MSNNEELVEGNLPSSNSMLVDIDFETKQQDYSEEMKVADEDKAGPYKKQRASRKRSDVWVHFSTFTDVAGKTKNVPTRWNSTYLMLETAQPYERAFKRYETTDPHYKEALAKVVGEEETGPGVPDCIDWVDANKLVGILHSFYDLTLKMSRTKSVSSNSFFEDITCIDVLLIKTINEVDDSSLSTMAKMMKAKFDKYFGDINRVNMTLYIACVLDPRNKLEYVELVLGDVYGKVDGNSRKEIIKDVLYDMYADYVRMHAASCSSFSTTNESSKYGFVGKRTSPIDVEPSNHVKEKFRMELKKKKI